MIDIVNMSQDKNFKGLVSLPIADFGISSSITAGSYASTVSNGSRRPAIVIAPRRVIIDSPSVSITVGATVIDRSTATVVAAYWS